MEITITAKNPTPEFQKDLLTLLDKHRAHLHLNPGWTPERAHTFYTALAPRAQRILRAALAGINGEVSATELRDTDGSSLRGHAGAFTRVLKRGVAEGWWGSGMQSPIVALGPGSGKVRGYRFRDEETMQAFLRGLAGPSTTEQ